MRPSDKVANPVFNVDRTLESLRRGHEERIVIMVFPELGISAYSIDDLVQQDALLDAVESAIESLRDASRTLLPVFAVGAPLRAHGRLYNTAVVVHAGRILGVVPKRYLPNYREFYERRHFAPGTPSGAQGIHVAGTVVPFGTDLLFRSEGLCEFVMHVELCEDL